MGLAQELSTLSEDEFNKFSQSLTPEEFKRVEQELSSTQQQQIPQEPINKYTGLEKFIVGATPIATSIAGGVLGAAGGLPGIIAGGATGAGAGRLLADNLETTFGGKEYTSKEMLKRAGGDAVVDALFTGATFGTGKLLKVTGGDKVIKSAFKPLKDVIMNTAEPIFRKKGLEASIKGSKSAINKIQSDVININNDILKNAKLSTKLGMKNTSEVITELSDNIDTIFTKLKPELDSGMSKAKLTLSNGYKELLEKEGTKEVALDATSLITKIDDLGLDDTLANRIKEQLGETADPLKGLFADNPIMKKKALEEMGINPLSVGKINVSKAHDLKLTIDNVIGALSSSKDKVAKRAIGKLGEIQDEVIGAIGKSTDGIYDELSKNYKRYFDVEKNINNVLGKVGTGAISDVRGKPIKDRLLKSLQNLKPGDDMFKETDDFLGKINSQINLLDDIGMHEASTTLKNGLVDLSSNLLKESDYKAIDKILKEVNVNMNVSDKVGSSELKKLLNIKKSGVVDKKSINGILKQSKQVKKMGSEVKALNKDIRLAKQAMSEITEFHSFNDRYMPMIMASTTASIIPGLATPIRVMAGIYTLYRLRNLGAYGAIKAIEKLAEKAYSKPLTKQSKIIFQQFVTGLVNDLRNSEY